MTEPFTQEDSFRHLMGKIGNAIAFANGQHDFDVSNVRSKVLEEAEVFMRYAGDTRSPLIRAQFINAAAAYRLVGNAPTDVRGN